MLLNIDHAEYSQNEAQVQCGHCRLRIRLSQPGLRRLILFCLAITAFFSLYLFILLDNTRRELAEQDDELNQIQQLQKQHQRTAALLRKRIKEEQWSRGLKRLSEFGVYINHSMSTMSNKLYQGHAEMAVNSLVLDPQSYTYVFPDKTAVVWSHFESWKHASALPNYLKLSLSCTAKREPTPFVHMLIHDDNAYVYAYDLHYAYYHMSLRDQEQYFAGRAMELYGGFYLSPTSIVTQPFLHLLENINGTDQEFCLLSKKQTRGLLGPFKAQSALVRNWRRAVHKILTPFMTAMDEAQTDQQKEQLIIKLKFPYLEDYLRASTPAHLLNCRTAQGKYVHYISHDELRMQFPGNETHDLIANSNTHFARALRERCADIL